jgi:hypothetical protein
MGRLRVLALTAGVSALSLVAPGQAAEDPVSELANAICAAPDLNAITAALSTLAAEDALAPEEVAEAFGVATFLGDLGRCTNRQAIADGFVLFKKGKDIAQLDAAFAAGRVAAKPEGGTASAEVYQGSFASLGTAGDPPSGQ